ncbi:hypothetical protein BVH06_04985 [Pseudomonas sp. PA27(2017)]|nr:hypothetical protein BVH06_04985 [Pseudomonas sp. PA27(2017)]
MLEQELALLADPSVLWSCPDYPLAIAASQNNVAMMDVLLAKGMPLYINTKYASRDGDVTDFTLASSWGVECHKAIMYLIEKGARVRSDNVAYMPVVRVLALHDHSVCTESDEFFTAVSDGVDIDAPIGNGESLLHLISTLNNRYVPKLIAQSKDVNAASASGRRPLSLAVLHGADLAVEALLSAGASTGYFVGESYPTVIALAQWVNEYKSNVKLLGTMGRILALLGAADE